MGLHRSACCLGSPPPARACSMGGNGFPPGEEEEIDEDIVKAILEICMLNIAPNSYGSRCCEHMALRISCWRQSHHVTRQKRLQGGLRFAQVCSSLLLQGGLLCEKWRRRVEIWLTSRRPTEVSYQRLQVKVSPALVGGCQTGSTLFYQTCIFDLQRCVQRNRTWSCSVPG